jgi:hypothetical protein
MKTKLIILLSLLFMGIHNNMSAGCGEAYLSISNVGSIGYMEPWDTKTYTFFLNLNDSTELTANKIGNCNDQPQFTSILFNGSEIWSPGSSSVKRIKIKNNQGLYTIKIFMWLQAIQRTYIYNFYISNKMAVGINEAVEINSGLVLAPNPASGQFRIESTASIQSVSVFDLTGKQLAFVPAYANGLSIPLNDYPRGIYMVKVAIDPEKVVVKKLVVQ